MACLIAAMAPGSPGCRFDHFYVTYLALIDGLGVGVGPMPIIEHDVAAGRLVLPFREIRTEAQRYICLTPVGVPKTAVHRVFGDWLTSPASHVTNFRFATPAAVSGHYGDRFDSGASGHSSTSLRMRRNLLASFPMKHDIMAGMNDASDSIGCKADSEFSIHYADRTKKEVIVDGESPASPNTRQPRAAIAVISTRQSAPKVAQSSSAAANGRDCHQPTPTRPCPN